MSRIGHFIVGFNPEENILFSYDKIKKDIYRYYDFNELMFYFDSLNYEVYIQWRGLDKSFNSIADFLLRQGYMSTTERVRNKMGIYEVNFLSTVDNGVFQIIYKRPNKHCITIMNLDKLLCINDEDLCDFSDSDFYIMKIVDAVDFLDRNEIEGLTIGAACMRDFRRRLKHNKFFLDKYCIGESYCDLLLDELFPSLDDKMPDLTKIDYNEKTKKIREIPITYWEYVYDAYKGRGGLCICEYPDTILEGYFVCSDENSGYPSVMHSSSGNRYPVGKPAFSYKKLNNLDETYWYITEIEVKLILKKDGVNFLNIDTDIRDEDLQYIDPDKIRITCTDLELMYENYYVQYIKYNNFLYFKTEIGLFDDYIDYWYNMKMNSEPGTAPYRLSKLMMNNLHGKFGSKPMGEIYDYFLYEDKPVKQKKNSYKKTSYIPIGAAVFSYSRRLLIDAIKKNRPNFIYCDTDSVHTEGNPIGINIDQKKLGCWKTEHVYDRAVFVGQKRYILHENKNGRWQYKVTWSGMPLEYRLVMNLALCVGDGSLGTDDKEITDKFYSLMYRRPDDVVHKKLPEAVMNYIKRGLRFEDLLGDKLYSNYPPGYTDISDAYVPGYVNKIDIFDKLREKMRNEN